MNADPQANRVQSEAETPPRPKGTYEIKFLIDQEQSDRIMDWARRHLNPDPHAGGEQGDVYLVNSLYLDTPGLDVFHRSDRFRQRKYRLRRYGSESRVWMEVKRKRKGAVRKRRVSVDDHHVMSRLMEPLDESWEGAWFRRRIDTLQFQPVCQVTYRRFARVGKSSVGPIRLTMDDELTGCPANQWHVPCGPLTGIPLLTNKRVLELKFQAVVPNLFRQLIQDEKLRMTSFSKYRTSVEECVSLDRIAGEV